MRRTRIWANAAERIGNARSDRADARREESRFGTAARSGASPPDPGASRGGSSVCSTASRGANRSRPRSICGGSRSGCGRPAGSSPGLVRGPSMGASGGRGRSLAALLGRLWRKGELPGSRKGFQPSWAWALSPGSCRMLATTTQATAVALDPRRIIEAVSLLSDFHGADGLYDLFRLGLVARGEHEQTPIADDTDRAGNHEEPEESRHARDLPVSRPLSRAILA